MAERDDLQEIHELVEEIEGIILLDLRGIGGTWKEHIDAIYTKLQQIRTICRTDE